MQGPPFWQRYSTNFDPIIQLVSAHSGVPLWNNKDIFKAVAGKVAVVLHFVEEFSWFVKIDDAFLASGVPKLEVDHICGDLRVG